MKHETLKHPVRCGNSGAWHGNIGGRRGVSGDCSVGIKLHRCVTELLILELWVFFPDLNQKKKMQQSGEMY